MCGSCLWLGRAGPSLVRQTCTTVLGSPPARCTEMACDETASLVWATMLHWFAAGDS